MFKDMDLSKESVASFKNSKVGSDKSQGVDLYVNVLSQSAWPTYPEIPVIIPPSLASYLDAFSQFYVEKHSGRKLTWRHSLSHCILKGEFLKVGVVCVIFSDRADDLQGQERISTKRIPSGSAVAVQRHGTLWGLILC